ncbi:MAG: CAP domain-containing protein [Pseudomonadota bacterium]
MRAALIALLSASALVACAPTPIPQPVGFRIISPQEADAVRTKHVDTLNAFRAEQGLPALTLSARLTAAAATHARDMSNQKRAWHFGSDGTSPKDRADRAGYDGLVVGENISESFDDEFELFNSWAVTPGTRAVMLEPSATDIGFAWFQEENGKLWWVQVLGRRNDAFGVAQTR